MTYNSFEINDLQKKAHWVMTPNGRFSRGDCSRLV